MTTTATTATTTKPHAPTGWRLEVLHGEQRPLGLHSPFWAGAVVLTRGELETYSEVRRAVGRQKTKWLPTWLRDSWPLMVSTLLATVEHGGHA